MTDLITWLRTQLDTDEETARSGHLWTHVADPARVLRQVLAHRAIVDLHGFEIYTYGNGETDRFCKTCGSGEPHEYPVDWPCETLRALASIYSDRDGYREEWAA